MNDEHTETSQKSEASATSDASEASQEYVDLKDAFPEVSENWVRDHVFYSGGGPRLVIDLGGMLRAAEDGGHTLLVDQDRHEFRTMPAEMLLTEKAGRIFGAGLEAARFIKMERVVEASEDPDIVDLTIEVYSRLETYRVEDSSGYFASEGEETVEIEELDEIETYDEEGRIVAVARLKQALAIPEGLSDENAEAHHARAVERVETQLVSELECLDQHELWDFYQMFMGASHEAMKKKKLWGRIKKAAKADDPEGEPAPSA